MQHGSLVGKVSMFTRAQGTAAQNFCGSLFAMLKHAHLEVAYHCWQVIVSLPRTATCHGRSIQPRGHQLRPCECTGHCFLSVVDYVASRTSELESRFDAEPRFRSNRSRHLPECCVFGGQRHALLHARGSTKRYMIYGAQGVHQGAHAAEAQKRR